MGLQDIGKSQIPTEFPHHALSGGAHDFEPFLSDSLLMDYQRLDFANFEIRLLRILPPENNHPKEAIVSCQLFHTSLISPVAYETLSYCWGDPAVTAPINIDGHKVEVTVNLEAALTSFGAEE